MKKSQLLHPVKKDKGQVGLTVLLSVIAMIFIIGFLVMVFAIIGSDLASDQRTASSITVTNQTGAINATGYQLVAVAGQNLNARGWNILIASNNTRVLGSGNYTVSATGLVTNTTTATIPGTWSPVNFTFTYTFDANNTATDTITDTTAAIAGVTEWFPIIITISIMVALILLTVIIIVAIRGSGILGNREQ